MDSDRWERAKEIFAAALEREEGDRLQVVADACEGDEALQREVESLLSGHNDAGEFMKSASEHPAFDAPTSDNPPTTFSVGQVICGRYKVLRFIGRGGMGEVYEAKDLELGTRLALKTIRPEISAIPETLSRFRQEIKLARRVTHPNVCRIYDWEHYQPPGDSGESEITFITMELLEGETLAARLSRRGHMSIEEALPLVQQMADGLAAAHEAGVVHCDFKPGNVMLVARTMSDSDSAQTVTSLALTSSGSPSPAASRPPDSLSKSPRAVITDFGLSHAYSVAPGRAPSSQRGRRQIIGTPAYMAPEQLEGRKATPATDIYALGLVIYEMVTGHQPFPGDTYERLREPPPSPRVYVPDLDQRWESMILRCVERDASLRYASAEDLAKTLVHSPDRGPILEWLRRRRLWVAAGLLGLLALLLVVLRFTGGGRIPPATKGGLVVLPFTAVGGRPEEVAYCDGFTETVTTRLGQLPSLAVPPAFEVRKKNIESAEEAGKEFGARFVLKATWQRLGDDIRIDLALVDTRTLLQAHTRIVDGKANDLFALQNQVVEAAVGMLDVASPAGLPEGTSQPVAYDYYIQGRGYLQSFQKPESVDSAIQAFERAIQLDPKYGLAHAGLGEGYWRRFEHTKDHDLVNEAREECTRAVGLGNAGAQAYICLGLVYNGTGQYEQAADQFQRAIELEPTNDDGYVGLAQAYEGLNKIEDAVETYRKAIALRPELVAPYNWLGMLYLNHGNYHDAADMFTRVTAIAPQNDVGHSNLGVAYSFQARYSEAIKEFQKSIALRPSYFAYSNLGTAYFSLRRFTEAARNYEFALNISGSNYAVWGNLGDAYTWAPGEGGKARAAYQEAISRATQALSVNARDYSALGYRATYHAMIGERNAALADIGKALQLAPTDAETMMNAAHVYDQLGDRDHAILWLQRALAAGSPASDVRDNPYFDDLHKDSRFAALFQN
ncbi:MAG TPA: tetratricopeptide repeat protein [Terriglobia bacterium]